MPFVRDVQARLLPLGREGDDRRRAACVHAADAPAPAVQIAHQVAGEVRRRVDVDVHHRLEDGRAGAGHRVLEGETAGHLEREFVGVHLVIGAVIKAHLEVDDGISGKISATRRFHDSLLYCGNEVLRDSASEDVVNKLKAA